MHSSTSHVLLTSPPAWGHLRPLVGLACKLVQKRPGSLVITLPVVGDFKRMVEKDIDRHLQSENHRPLKDDIHVISLGGEGESDAFSLIPIMFQNFEAFYIFLHSMAPIRCASGCTYTYTRAPDVVIADFFFLDGVYLIRKITEGKVPILCWNSATPGSVMRFIGPEALGGVGDLEAKTKALVAKTGKSYEEAELEVFHPKAGEVVTPPGMPPMYDYEYYPNESDPKMLAAQIPLHKQAYKMLHECDGLLSATSLAFEPEGSNAIKAWFAESNKPMYTVGPIFPDDILKDVSDSQSISPDDRAVVAFLDKVYATSGAHSLLYISFGTMFWPKGEGIWNTVEYILDSGIPLFLSHDESRLGKIPDHIEKKFNESDKASTSAWAPQQTILQHRATGWFMTHCGHNGMMEATIQGVPMIAWPMDAEQPGNAAYISVKLNIGYEIVEGRSGLGLKPMYRGVTPKGTLEALRDEIKVILEKAFGEDGKVKRENARVLKEKMRAGLRDGGDSSVDLDKLIRDYLNA